MPNISSILSSYFNQLVDFICTPFNYIKISVLGSNNKAHESDKKTPPSLEQPKVFEISTNRTQDSVEPSDQPQDLDNQGFNGMSENYNRIYKLFDELSAKDASYDAQEKELAQKELEELNNAADIAKLDDDADLEEYSRIANQAKEHVKAIKLESDVHAFGGDVPGVGDAGSESNESMQTDLMGVEK